MSRAAANAQGYSPRHRHVNTHTHTCIAAFLDDPKFSHRRTNATKCFLWNFSVARRRPSLLYCHGLPRNLTEINKYTYIYFVVAFFFFLLNQPT